MSRKEYKNEALGVKFTLPDPLTLRHATAYSAKRDEMITAGSLTEVSSNWFAAWELIEDWESEHIQDQDTLKDEDAVLDSHGKAMQTILWVANVVNLYVINELYVSKN